MHRRLVIDSNMIQSTELFDLLVAGDAVAVLPDYVWVECYKQASLPSVKAFLSIIGGFPDRVVLLQPGKFLAGLDSRRAGYAAEFERPGVGDDLRAMSVAMSQAEYGEPAVFAQLCGQWGYAAAVMEDMLKGAADITPSLPEIATMFTPDELRRCRTQGKYTPAMTEKVFGSAFQIYENLTEIDGRLPLLEPRFAVQTFYYRFALGTMIHCLWWIRNGSPPIVRLDRLRNDYVDLGLAVCATYYDGLMTNDAKAAWMHEELSNALNFARSAAANVRESNHEET